MRAGLQGRYGPGAGGCRSGRVQNLLPGTRLSQPPDTRNPVGERGRGWNRGGLVVSSSSSRRGGPWPSRSARPSRSPWPQHQAWVTGP